MDEESIVREDGTVVQSYHQDGDGNPATRLTAEEGGGYLWIDPDHKLSNNLDGEKFVSILLIVADERRADMDGNTFLSTSLKNMQPQG